MKQRTVLVPGVVSLLLISGAVATAEDLRLANGRTFREVRVVTVRPDALVIAHRDGMVLADYEELPKAVRARYGFDSRKAKAFREQEVAARKVAAEENRRLIAEYERRKLALVQKRIASDDPDASTFAGFGESQLTYRPGGAERAYDTAVSQISEEIARIEEARIAEARKPDTFWNAPFWKNPVVTFIGSLLGAGGGGHERGFGFNSEPRGWR
jgi:hypothetical protein